MSSFSLKTAINQAISHQNKYIKNERPERTEGGKTNDTEKTFKKEYSSIFPGIKVKYTILDSKVSMCQNVVIEPNFYVWINIQWIVYNGWPLR